MTFSMLCCVAEDPALPRSPLPTCPVAWAPKRPTAEQVVGGFQVVASSSDLSMPWRHVILCESTCTPKKDLIPGPQAGLP